MAGALVLTAGCTSSKGGKKKKTSTTSGSSGGIDEKIWTAGFAGCIRIAGEGRCTADGIDEVDPDTTMGNSLFVVFTNHLSGLSVAGSPDEYDMDLTYTYTLEGGTITNPEDYFESKVVNGDKTVVFLKNFPAKGTAIENCPKIHVEAKGVIEGNERVKNYTLRLNGYDGKFHKMPISEIYTPKATCFDWMTDQFTSEGIETPIANCYGPDATKFDEWWKNETSRKTHASIETYGYITYMSPDKNNGILECGNQAIQLYQIAGYAGWEPTKDVIMNKPVLVRGELSGGYGNLQMSYIKEIFPAPSDVTVEAPAAPAAFTESMISNTSWSENPIFNKVCAATSVTYAGNLQEIKNQTGGNPTIETKVSDPNTANFSAERYEFDVQIGSATLTVQTDYHIIERYPELASSLKSIVTSSVGTSCKIGGTIRWLNKRYNADGSDFAPGNDSSTRTEGKWEIVPYLPEHASLAQITKHESNLMQIKGDIVERRCHPYFLSESV